MLAAWGGCAPAREPESGPESCAADIDGDGAVGFDDLELLLSTWGAAP
jgi:hypothetical protein